MSDRKNTTAIPRMRGCANIDIDIIDDRGFDRFVAPAAIARAGPVARAIAITRGLPTRRIATRARHGSLSRAGRARGAGASRLAPSRASRASLGVANARASSRTAASLGIG